MKLFPNKSLETINKIIEIVNNKEKGAYLRYGDGDFNIMTGQNELLNKYSSNMQKELIESINIDDPNYLIGTLLICKKYNLLEDKMWPGNHEWPENRCDYYYKLIYKLRKNRLLITYYTYVAFNYYLTTYKNESYVLMKKLRDQCIMNEVIFVGNNDINKDVINLYFGNHTFIECPNKNSYDSIDKLNLELFKEINKNNSYKIIILCCGVTTRCVIKRLWLNKELTNYFALDFGSIIDALSGLTTRQYIIDTKFDNRLFNDGFEKYINSTKNQ